MATFFYSDPHFYHHRIRVYVPARAELWATTEEMNRGLIERHNAVVGPEDEVICVGDFSLSEKVVPEILPQLNGKRRILVAGNHDAVHICHKKHEAATKRYIEYGFTEVHQEIRFGPFLVNHLPYMGANDSGHEGRYPQFRPKNQGSFLLCGHVHDLWKTSGRMINVGVDVNNFTPVRYEELLALAGI